MEPKTSGETKALTKPGGKVSEKVPSEMVVVPEVKRELTVDEMVNQIVKVKDLYKRVMKSNIHYGVIPGCGDKPTLLKPGAEMLLLMFQLTSKIEDKIIREFDNGHREYEIVLGLYHRATGTFWGNGTGLCTTMEKKYRYRGGSRKCPTCGKESIIKGQEKYGGGWLCWKKKDGCGAKFKDEDTSITSQSVDKIENPDIADEYNTVLKMAKKRALTDATLNATAVSDIFTQDIEDKQNGSTTQSDTQKKSEPQKKAPPKDITPEKSIHDELTDLILENLNILGCKTREQKEEISGLTNDKFKTAPIELLKEVNDRLKKAVLEMPAHEKPIEGKIPFDESLKGKVAPEENTDKLFEEIENEGGK